LSYHKLADFSSNNYGQGVQKLEPGNGLEQAIYLLTDLFYENNQLIDQSQ
jgi:hypothetical protein